MKQRQMHGDKKLSLFQGRFRNHNDVSGRTFYLCVGVYGSYCMPCPPGTYFFTNKDDRSTGECKVREEPPKGSHW